jgi:outer membrane protein
MTMTRRIVSSFFAASLAVVASQASAQNGHSLMPEGTHEVELGPALVSLPRHEGSSARELALMPSVRGNWSNGIFASLGLVGMDLSDDPLIGYGPILTYGVRQTRADEPSDTQAQLTAAAGAYVTYQVTPSIGLISEAHYGGGADRHGVSVGAGLDYVIHLASHHHLTLEMGVDWANADYMKSTFGVDAQQSRADGLSTHGTAAGVKDVAQRVDWAWEITNHVNLSTSVGAVHMTGSAATSPLVNQRTSGVYSTALSYRF